MSVRRLPKDANGHAIGILGIGPEVSSLGVAGTTSRVILPTGVQSGDCVRVACNTDCYIALGDDTVTATTADTLFLAGVEYLTIVANQTHLAAVQVGAPGVLTITEVY